MVRFQSGYPATEVDRTSREKSRYPCEESRRVELERRVFRPSRQKWEFPRVGIDGDAPEVGQRTGRSGVIEMPMREENRTGAAFSTEASSSGTSNQAFVARRARIEQDPRLFNANEVSIGYQGGNHSDAGGDFSHTLFWRPALRGMQRSDRVTPLVAIVVAASAVMIPVMIVFHAAAVASPVS